MIRHLIAQLSFAAFFAALGALVPLYVMHRERRKSEAKLEAELERKQVRMRAAFGSPQPGSAGFTIAAAMSGTGCLGRSSQDEPVFVLCGRDKLSSFVVREWVVQAEAIGVRPSKVFGARAIADRMDEWRAKHGGKTPD